LPRSNPQSPAESVLAALRAATAQRHAAIDRGMPLSRRNPSHADYVDHLLLMRAWLAPVAALPGASAHRQIELIDADLAEAGLPVVPAPAGKSLDDWRIDAHDSYLWGARYVIEGSRVGAAVLYRRLKDSLGPYELHFLRGGSGMPADRWPRFLRHMCTAVQSRAEIDAACAGACECFDALLLLIAPREAA
jgi:heme oxygenase